MTDDTHSGYIQTDAPAPRFELLVFSSPTCGPCHVMAGAVDAIEKEFAGRITVRRIDVLSAQYRLMSNRHDIRSVPTVLLMNGVRVVRSAVGLRSLLQLRLTLEEGIGDE